MKRCAHCTDEILETETVYTVTRRSGGKTSEHWGSFHARCYHALVGTPNAALEALRLEVDRARARGVPHGRDDPRTAS